ncbi:proteoglycan 4-like [Helianthus annuus]|uniref:proteoglycan 4-like n=1 Tax=Helianthus annuus TaxID=4232 RepID=UPI000B90293A|nr:proteoglycan 4-like [Helianthus annuus]
MSNDSLKQLARYHPNHPKPKKVAEFFRFIKDANYVDPDAVNHQNWRNEEEMKEAAYADELKALTEFKNTRNDWFVKEPSKRSKKATPKAQEEPVVNVEENQDADIDDVMINIDDLESEQAANIEVDVRLSPNSQNFLKKLNAFNAEKDKADVAQKEKVIDDVEGDDVDKSNTSSSSSSDDEIDETERLRRIQEETEKEKHLRKRKRQKKDDAAYIPSPEHVSESQSRSGGKKKVGARKGIVSPKKNKVTSKITKPKIVLKKKPSKEPSKPPTPPPEPTPHKSPIQSPPHQTPPQQPTPQRQPSPPKQPTRPRQPSPLHLSALHLSPPHEQSFLTSQ